MFLLCFQIILEKEVQKCTCMFLEMLFIKANAKALLLASDIMSSVSERKTTTSKIFWLCHFRSTEGS